MSIEKAKSRNTSADKTSIGFDYQYFYFISLLMDLEKGQKIGYEVLDDIHIELPDGQIIFMQLKHTFQKNSDGQSVNLTERDMDLWKTIYTWCLEVDKKETLLSKREFIANSKFVLVTNKSENENCFFDNYQKLIDGELSIANYRKYIKGLRDNSSKENPNKKFYKGIYSFTSELLILLMNKIEFNMNEDDLIEKIHNQIESKFVNKKRVDDVFIKIIGELTVWKYSTIKNCGKVELTYDQINSKLTRSFELARIDKLPRRKYELQLPDKLSEQNFIKELIDIGDIKAIDEELVIEYTLDKLKMFNHLTEWRKESLIGSNEVKLYNNESKLIWRNIHKDCHYETDEAVIDKIANDEISKINKKSSRKCLNKCRRERLKINFGEELEINLSNGQFYLMADDNKIGWKYEKKELYKIE